MCCANSILYPAFLLAVAHPAAALIDPITMGSVAVSSAAVFGYTLLYCKIKECCNEKWIPADFAMLKNDLSRNVFGQHLVQEIVVKALRGHLRSQHPNKALTLSFHGWPGGGKNYVAQFVTKRLFKKGAQSQYVHFFTGKIHFPLQEKADIYRIHLQDWIRGNVSLCARSMFVFDEVDKMPIGVLDGVKPFLDYHEEIDGVDFRKSIFIFISNAGGKSITRRHLELWGSGKKREDLQLRDFEDLLRKSTFNEEGGFQKSELIEGDLIDHYVPFLPMEESHVKQCIVEEFKRKGVPFPHDDHVTEVLKDITFGPKGSAMFSNTGCKRITQKVVTLIEKLAPDTL